MDKNVQHIDLDEIKRVRAEMNKELNKEDSNQKVVKRKVKELKLADDIQTKPSTDNISFENSASTDVAKIEQTSSNSTDLTEKKSSESETSKNLEEKEDGLESPEMFAPKTFEELLSNLKNIDDLINVDFDSIVIDDEDSLVEETETDELNQPNPTENSKPISYTKSDLDERVNKVKDDYEKESEILKKSESTATTKIEPENVELKSTIQEEKKVEIQKPQPLKTENGLTKKEETKVEMPVTPKIVKPVPIEQKTQENLKQNLVVAEKKEFEKEQKNSDTKIESSNVGEEKPKNEPILLKKPNLLQKPTHLQPAVKTDETAKSENVKSNDKYSELLPMHSDSGSSSELIKTEADLSDKNLKPLTVDKRNLLPEIEDFKFIDIIKSNSFMESDELTCIYGMGEDKNIICQNFKDFYNVAIFSDNDDEVFKLFSSIIISLTLKNSSYAIKYAICDSKNGSKFDVYNDLSHLFFNRIAKTNGEIIDTLNELSLEIEKRYENLAKLGVKNIEAFNEEMKKQNIAPMPYIILFFNNYTRAVHLDDSDKINSNLFNILKFGRLVGIYVNLVISDEKLDDKINFNLQTRISFKAENKVSSVNRIGDSGAERIDVSDEFVLKTLYGEEFTHLKVPSISQKEVELLIKNIEK